MYIFMFHNRLKYFSNVKERVLYYCETWLYNVHIENLFKIVIILSKIA